ncbi:hypothetical protein ARMGADRAFT_1066767 [Armillaria gallica]|uniref:Uncharacterized protein n=1 Tax=Armillaria gallica TaxID=47427 RepID=A0A2H3CS50_ARMGA|nr:hypothetical protein ARMGADRAFT_1066767 [Armillaria gallica]
MYLRGIPAAIIIPALPSCQTAYSKRIQTIQGCQDIHKMNLYGTPVSMEARVLLWHTKICDGTTQGMMSYKNAGKSREPTRWKLVLKLYEDNVYQVWILSLYDHGITVLEARRI